MVELIGDAVALYEPMAEATGRQIRFTGISCRRSVDRDLLFQAVANLLENALRHGGGDIEVSLQAAHLSVRDHGVGIAAADRERVLQPFVRLDESRSTAGSGLGLSLVRAISEAHHGRLQLDDAQPGLIASLWFDLDEQTAPTVPDGVSAAR
jgi:signal transduction histidine kinase